MGGFCQCANMNVVGAVVSSRQDCGTEGNSLYAGIAGYQRLQIILFWCPSPAQVVLKIVLTAQDDTCTDSVLHMSTGLWELGVCIPSSRSTPHPTQFMGSKMRAYDSPHPDFTLLELRVALVVGVRPEQSNVRGSARSRSSTYSTVHVIRV